MPDNLQEMLQRARQAQQVIEYWPQEKVDEMVASVGWELVKEENAVACAKLAFEETRMGIYEHKLLKHKKKALGTLRDLHGLKTVGVIEEDPEKGLIKIAKPVGVVGALTPVTNPTSTPASNGLATLKTRNAVIFAPHPRAKKCCALVTEHMRAGLERVGAPVDLIQSIKEPSVQGSQDLMAAVDLVVATGGGGMVKAAYSSGTPSYGVGAGNAVVIIDETADVVAAANNVYLSKTFDNATSCSSDNSLVVQESIWDQVVSELQSHAGYLCDAEEKARLKATMWPDGEHLNREIVARPATEIAAKAQIDVPEDTTFLMVMGEAIGPEDRFSAEKLSPVLTLWKYKEFPEAIRYVQDITAFNGHGHSCGLQTTSDEHILQLGEAVHCSRIMINQPQCYGNSGNYDNGMPFTLTLGCGTWGGNATSENVHWKHFLNVTWIAKPIPPVVPDEGVIFADLRAKYDL